MFLALNSRVIAIEAHEKGKIYYVIMEIGQERREMLTSPFSFNSGGRVCSACGIFQANPNALLICGKCKVHRYCNKECQRKGWTKYNHKLSCRPNHIQPPETSVSLFPKEADDPEDLDELKSIIVSYPQGTRDCTTKAGLMDMTMGLDEDSMVEILDNISNVEDKVRQSICERFNWPSGCIRKIQVPGFSCEWDGMVLYCFTDENYKISFSGALSENVLASNVIMVSCAEDEVVRGTAVFCCIDSENRIVRMTRRDLINIALMNQSAGRMNTVTERVHFENLRRAQLLAHLKSQGATTFQL